MEGENTENNLPPLSNGSGSHQTDISGSRGRGEVGSSNLTPSDESCGWKFAQDGGPDEQVSGATSNARIDDETTSDAPNWWVDGKYAGRPSKMSVFGTGSAQDFAQSCSQKRRKFVLSTKPEVREHVGIKAGSSSLQQDICCLPVVEEEITICAELQAILCGLRIGNELQHYSLVSTCLSSLAEQLGAIVFITGSSDQGYSNPSATERTTAFEVKDKHYILVERKEDRAIEIGTPVLRNGQWRWVIPKMFKALRSDFRLTFNGSTALHIHIGIGREYCLRDLKRISKAIILFERQMGTHHPGCRNPVSPTEWPYAYSYILPCRNGIPLRGLSETAMMMKIDEARYIPELIRIINYDYLVYAGELHRRYRYSFREVLRTNTIEFRQAIGTVDVSWTLDWIYRIIKFVTSAITTPDAKFYSWADQGIQDLGTYHRFGVPSPPETGFRLRVQMRAPRSLRTVRVMENSIGRYIGKARKKTVYVFKQVRAGKIGQELYWFVYYWGKIDGRLGSSRPARVLFPTVILVSRTGKQAALG